MTRRAEYCGFHEGEDGTRFLTRDDGADTDGPGRALQEEGLRRLLRVPGSDMARI